ncbi:Uncharacterised protein [Mesomycoplasma conjunctivae]|nr:Uncharacterised protein [Mesomycoplasma conjunctivae]
MKPLKQAKNDKTTSWVRDVFNYITTPHDKIDDLLTYKPFDYGKVPTLPKPGISYNVRNLVDKYPRPYDIIFEHFLEDFKKELNRGLISKKNLLESIKTYTVIKSFYGYNNCLQFIKFDHDNSTYYAQLVYIDIYNRQEPDLQIKAYFKEYSEGEARLGEPLILEQTKSGQIIVLERYYDYEEVKVEVDYYPSIVYRPVDQEGEITERTQKVKVEKLRFVEYSITIRSTIIDYFPTLIAGVFDVRSFKIVGNIEDYVNNYDETLQSYDTTQNEKEDFPIFDFKKIDLRESVNVKHTYSILVHTHDNKLWYATFVIGYNRRNNVEYNTHGYIKFNDVNLGEPIQLTNLKILKLTTGFYSIEEQKKLLYNATILGELDTEILNKKDYLIDTKGYFPKITEVSQLNQTSYLYALWKDELEQNVTLRKSYFLIDRVNGRASLRFSNTATKIVDNINKDLNKDFSELFKPYREVFQNRFLSKYTFEEKTVRVKIFSYNLIDPNKYSAEYSYLDYELSDEDFRNIFSKSRVNISAKVEDFYFDKGIKFKLALYINGKKHSEKVLDFKKYEKIFFDIQVNLKMYYQLGLSRLLNSTFSLSGISDDKNKEVDWNLDIKMPNVEKVGDIKVFDGNKFFAILKIEGQWGIYLFDNNLNYRDGILAARSPQLVHKVNNVRDDESVKLFGIDSFNSFVNIPFYAYDRKIGALIYDFDKSKFFTNIWDLPRNYQIYSPLIAIKEEYTNKILLSQPKSDGGLNYAWMNIILPNHYFEADVTASVFSRASTDIRESAVFSRLDANNKEISIEMQNTFSNGRTAFMQGHMNAWALSSVVDNHQVKNYTLYDNNGHVATSLNYHNIRKKFNQLQTTTVAMSFFVYEGLLPNHDTAGRWAEGLINYKKFDNLKFIDYKYDIYKNGVKSETIIGKLDRDKMEIENHILWFDMCEEIFGQDPNAEYEIVDLQIGEQATNNWRRFKLVDADPKWKGTTPYTLGGRIGIRVSLDHEWDVEEEKRRLAATPTHLKWAGDMDY